MLTAGPHWQPNSGLGRHLWWSLPTSKSPASAQQSCLIGGQGGQAWSADRRALAQLVIIVAAVAIVVRHTCQQTRNFSYVCQADCMHTAVHLAHLLLLCLRELQISVI